MTLYQDEQRRKYMELKRTLKCVDCGLQDHRVLQFHHREKGTRLKSTTGKKLTMASIAVNTSMLEKEIGKCDVLCANCHAIRHYKDD